ncbi:GNAT family N-acetyltransferase [Oleiagrimonas sp. C23AA]|nr:GNAT family N-acetyltransferase [Oleiagrimonas sp. C23AA]NII09703.1 GNAT family N-acetyltransferase [Oleiagrimonas sp. C23AA]
MVQVYSALPGFPQADAQPRYYATLARVGDFVDVPGARVLVALDESGTLLGGVVYFADMAHYGSGGPGTDLQKTSGIRLLVVDPDQRGRGVGRALTEACITLARQAGHRQVVLHSTRAMQVAWRMYQRMGFERVQALDFMQGELGVFGFRLAL